MPGRWTWGPDSQEATISTATTQYPALALPALAPPPAVAAGSSGADGPERVVVVLATFNERACIGATIEALAAVAVRVRPACELRVLLVDDESPDGTAEHAVAVAAHHGLDLAVSSAPRAGLGRAYLRGFAAVGAQGWADTVVTLDADGQHDPAVIPDLLAARTRERADLLIGSRWVRGGRVVGLTAGRRLLSRFGNVLFSVVTGTHGVHDATTAYRVFSADVAASFDPGSLSVSGYSFFSSFVGVASARGLRIAEHPILFAPRAGGASKLEVRDVLQFARNLPALRRQVQVLRANANERPWVRVQSVGAAGR